VFLSNVSKVLGLRFYLFYSFVLFSIISLVIWFDLLICYHYSLTHVWATVSALTCLVCAVLRSQCSILFYNVQSRIDEQINGDGDEVPYDCCCFQCVGL